MLLPQYRWLHQEPGPKLLLAALADVGVTEIPGTKSNPTILAWAKEAGLEKEYANDDTPWCGLAVAHWVKQAGYEPVAKPLWALNWQTWGTKAPSAMLGDVLVFKRKLPSGGFAGHVGLYVGEDATAYHVLGGNQDNQVNVTRVLKSRRVAIRRSPWAIKQPANVRAIKLQSAGTLSTNEA